PACLPDDVRIGDISLAVQANRPDLGLAEPGHEEGQPLSKNRPRCHALAIVADLPKLAPGERIIAIGCPGADAADLLPTVGINDQGRGEGLALIAFTLRFAVAAEVVPVGRSGRFPDGAPCL